MGKSRKTTTENKIDPAMRKMAEKNYEYAKQVAALGYEPNRGVTVAGFTPRQQQAMGMTNQAASAFGFGGMPEPMEGMPAMETNAQGIRGYSMAPSYDDMMSKFPPEYLAAIEQIFSNLRGANKPQAASQPAQKPNPNVLPRPEWKYDVRYGGHWG